ncbi:MAG: hypothetical protein JXA99_04665 [Candidatus Lokiarchaeota archaeon]|nr:hypothetical protein [Candidatus Lokiarchaeota archaeon]
MKEDTRSSITLEMGVIKIDLIKYDDILREDARKLNKLIIAEESITIQFIHPINMLKVFKSKGGFTKMQLYKCIYEGYKQMEKDGVIYDLELTNYYLEEVNYNKATHICTIHLGT